MEHLHSADLELQVGCEAAGGHLTAEGTEDEEPADGLGSSRRERGVGESDSAWCFTCNEVPPLLRNVRWRGEMRSSEREEKTSFLARKLVPVARSFVLRCVDGSDATRPKLCEVDETEVASGMFGRN